MAGEPILIVDDNAANLKLARVLLHAEGYDVRTAVDAEQALTLLDSFTPRLILMDIQLPGMDGLELTRKLKSNPTTQDILIVALTAYAMRGDEERVRAAGCDGYIAKPIDPDTLPELIASYLERSPARAPDGREPPLVLVVEDNTANRAVFSRALEEAGYRVAAAAAAAAALSSAEREAPGLVVQDLSLPDSTPGDLSAALRLLPGCAALPIVALSGLLGSPSAALHGFDAVLLKPIEVDRLVRMVQAHLPIVEPGSDRPGQGRRVLIADDDPAQRKLTAIRFGQLGFEVMQVADGVAALEAARSFEPHIVLSDVLMPGLDGFELCVALRGEAGLRDVPVVLTSAHYGEDRDIDLARRAGAHALVARTPSMQEMITAVVDGLEGGVAAPPLEPVERIAEEHARRVIKQLERQATANAGLLQRCALQYAQLSILGAVSESLATSADSEAVLGEALAACLDAGGISKGAIYRRAEAGEQLVLHCSVGFQPGDRADLEAGFGRSGVIESVVGGAGARVLTAREKPRLDERDLLARLDVALAVIVPLMAGGARVGALLLGTSTPGISAEDLVSFGRSIGAHIGHGLALGEAFTRANASERRARALMENANDAIFVAGPNGKIVETNRGGERLLDRPASDIVGSTFDGFFAPAFGDRVLRARAALLAQGAMRLDDAPIVQPSGDTVYVDVSGAVVETGGSLLLLFIVRDITGRRRADEERVELLRREQEARFEAERASRAKDEFISTLSHELRTPLTAILGWACILHAKEPDGASLARGLATIERNARIQVQLIDDILDVSRISTGKLRLDLRITHVNPVVQAALDVAAPPAEAKGVRLESNVAAADAKVLGDADRLQQVLWNLLSNGIKFTKRGGRVNVDINERDGHVELRVSDTGEGIHPDFLPHVFDRFRQADGSSTRSHGGLGLGLAIVRHLIELHGGTVRAESPGMGHGATFTVLLPSQGQLVNDGWAHPSPLERAPLSASAPPVAAAALRGLRILLVEDEPDSREMLARVLVDLGAEVAAVGSAADALEALSHAIPDVLVSDIGMPRMDGYALLRKVRALPADRGGRTPAIALTAYVTADDARRAIHAGFESHLAKPIDPAALIAAIHKLSARGGQ